ncbi:bifunctional serine/threonine-protein kinase/formylglycine-generating enzyme family protein [Novilysobacter antarcticus]|uniref:bifunctional serine/threonine-protein kinase/formylglycine-generating enzyme family protein n=1 Tax=Novilysobacter antarcticus TaxID=2862543 RepID=UPI001C99C605|nr:bifunctional serine/threonine-protein kinase/formylglycine-generating enzyme family protein [Lysobacter antarcticus]
MTGANYIDDEHPLPEIRGYRLLRVLNRGGMSTVYLAEQIAPSREVAIKVMAPNALSDEVSRRRFENEVRTIARLEHPHVVRIHELGRTADGLPYYTMPYLARGHLGQRSFLRDDGRPDEPRIIATLRILLSALEYAHGRGVVHRDVKAENVLFGDTEQPLLADFGIALRRGFGPRVTATGLAVGSTAYMAPEQARGEDVDGRADLYSLGVLAWEMLTGRLPYEAGDALAMAVMHAQNPIPKLPAHLRHWQRFMNRALAKQPAHRFADTGQMAAMLDQVERRGRWPRATLGRDRLVRVLSRVPGRVWVVAGIVAILGMALQLGSKDPAVEEAERAAQRLVDEATRDDPIPAMLEPLPEAPLQIALDKARQQIAQNRLTTPDDDNAFSTLMAAWASNPEDPAVAALVDALTAALGKSALANLAEGRDEQASRQIERIRLLGTETASLESAAQLRLSEAIEKTLDARIARAADRLDSSAATAIAALAAPMGLAPATVRRLQARAAAVPTGSGPGAGTNTVVVALATKPVSRDEYAAFAEATGRKPARCRERSSLLRVLAPRDWRAPGFEQQGADPVLCVSIADAQAYAEWLQKQTGRAYRLPTIVESRSIAPQISGREISLWQLDCGEGCQERAVLGESWRKPEGKRVLDAERGYDDVGFRLLRDP